MVLGGWLTDRLSPRDARWFLWLPALQAAIGAPFTVLFLYLDQLGPALACYAVHWVLNASYNAPIYALMQTLAGARTRALAVATHLFIVNLIGLTLGPFLIGYMNDGLHERTATTRAIRYSMMVAGLTTRRRDLLHGRRAHRARGRRRRPAVLVEPLSEPRPGGHVERRDSGAA